MASEINLTVNIVPALDGFFDEPFRYYVLYGGRGSGKSWGVAAELVLRAMLGKERILCAREFQTSIKQSVKKLLEDTIDRMGVKQFFKILDQSIICRQTGSEFLFTGLWNNTASVKSMEGITICWVEEAQSVTETSMEVLIPTVRAAGSFFIFTMNPTLSSDWVYKEFVVPAEQRPNARRILLNYVDNPWFAGSPLEQDMLWDKKMNPSKYRHVWLGEIMIDADALVFPHNVSMDTFDAPARAQHMQGADFGFAQDPTTLLRTHLSKDEKTIYVEYEVGGVRVELDDHPALYERIPDVRRHPIIADSARPETISYLSRKGFAIRGAAKGKGSVEDGIGFLQSKNIVVHTRCPKTFSELKGHQFMRHHQTNEIMPKTEDKNNHFIDALRYAWEGKWNRIRLRIAA